MIFKVIIGVVLASLAVLSLLVYETLRKKLLKILDLEVELNPPEIQRGNKLDFVLHSNPSKTIKAHIVEGEVTCRRFNNWLSKNLYELNIPFVTGTVLVTYVFSMGRDLMFVTGTDSQYGGYIPIDADADATSDDKISPVMWDIKVRVHAIGYLPAVIRKELRVLSYHPAMIESQGKQVKAEEAVNIYKPRKRADQGLITVTLGDGKTNGDVQKKNSSERFGFLELEENENGKNKNLKR